MRNIDLDLEIGGKTTEPLTGTIEPAAPALLVTVEPTSVQTVFASAGQLDPLIAAVAEVVRAHTPDVSTAKGRAEIASLAHKVSKTKAYLDDLGKNLVAGLKELPKKIDANRLAMRTQLDALRDEARAPLDKWEAEQARLEAEEKAREEAAALLVQIDRDHEMALLMNEQHNRQAEDRARVAEQARIEREEQIRREAADRARIEAEARAKYEREESMRRELEAKLATERAEMEKAEAEQRAKLAEERAEREREEAKDREEQARIEATQAERRRQEAEAARIKAEQEKREADQEHRRAFNREAAADLVACGITEDQAKAVVVAVLSGKVRHLRIEY